MDLLSKNLDQKEKPHQWCGFLRMFLQQKTSIVIHRRAPDPFESRVTVCTNKHILKQIISQTDIVHPANHWVRYTS